MGVLGNYFRGYVNYGMEWSSSIYTYPYIQVDIAPSTLRNGDISIYLVWWMLGNQIIMMYGGDPLVVDLLNI